MRLVFSSAHARASSSCVGAVFMHPCVYSTAQSRPLARLRGMVRAPLLIVQAGSEGPWESCYRKARWTEEEVTAGAAAIYRQAPSCPRRRERACRRHSGSTHAVLCFSRSSRALCAFFSLRQALRGVSSIIKVPSPRPHDELSRVAATLGGVFFRSTTRMRCGPGICAETRWSSTLCCRLARTTSRRSTL